MNMKGGDTLLAAAKNMSCCIVKAPLPAPQYKISDSLVASAPANAPEAPVEFTSTQQTHGLPPAQHPSPPKLQSLLCTFLV
ncbi:MAG TPA: hypothetical protein VGS15_04625 [Candidatus Acidoferrales bacterium]|nr:hypothetical protein [Candidatus Acidoferrales bacterium]